MFTFLTVLSILVSTIELVEAIRALFELFYLNYFKTVLRNVYILFWYVLRILVPTINSLVWSWMGKGGLDPDHQGYFWNICLKTLSKLFLNYYQKIFSTLHRCATFLKRFAGIPLRNHEVIQLSLTPNKLVRSWMWIAWSGPLRLFFGLFFPWNYFKPIYKLCIKMFTFLTVLSILVSTIELVEAIRALFDLFYPNYFKTMLKYLYIFLCHIHNRIYNKFISVELNGNSLI